VIVILYSIFVSQDVVVIFSRLEIASDVIVKIINIIISNNMW